MQLLFFPPCLPPSWFLPSYFRAFRVFRGSLHPPVFRPPGFFPLIFVPFVFFVVPKPRASGKFLLDTKACDTRRGALEGRVQ
jgi:hypothetical protein